MVTLTSVLTCPVCQQPHSEQMPTNACQYFYECPSCRTVLKPLAGDCCVFCSYGSVPCPPIQEQGPGTCGCC
ncbi:GDCCVxC domain-containing (seleno)protein [Hymenobacter segetis]|uniref:GDCCVxC domain-containing (Seleno)protein n=2 Tax=Hymenobacter segetis TaxID=2025509 RepID=A0ABU9LWY2_9BACT